MSTDLESWATITSLCKSPELLSTLQCPYCRNLLSVPVQTSCGHRLCQACADKIINTTCPPKCPQLDCGEEFTTEDGVHYFPDRFVRREIQRLPVRCRFVVEGCTWEDTYAELNSHLAKCTYSLLKMKLCPLEPLNCPKKGPMDDNDLNEHLMENMFDHLTFVVNNIQQLWAKLSKMEGHDLQPYKRVQSDGADYRSEVLSGGERITYYEHVEEDGGVSSIKWKDIRGAPHPMPGKRPFTTSLEVPNSPSISQLREIVTKEIEDVKDKLFRSMMDSLRSKEEEIASLRTQITKLEKQIRSKNAEFEDRDFRLSLIENSNHDGSMIWKIPQFSQRKADAENGKYTSIFSLPFHSGRYGYKMCLRLYIMGDGIGKGTHFSLFFVVMRGEFDNILPWPFTHKVTFKLLNQAGGRDIVDTFQPDPMSSSFRKPKSDMNIASGCPRFVSHTELERGGFIVDDTIFIKCMIDTSTIRHP